MIVFVSVSTRQAFFIIHPLVAFSFYTPSTCISLFLLSSHCEHFIPPPKKCTGIIKWQKTLSMFRACVVVISGKNLLLVFWGMTVHVCHSLLYTHIYMFQIGIICISTDCRHFELALEMMKCCPSCFDDHQWLPTYLSFLVYLLVQQRNNIALQWW